LENPTDLGITCGGGAFSNPRFSSRLGKEGEARDEDVKRRALAKNLKTYEPNMVRGGA